MTVRSSLSVFTVHTNILAKPKRQLLLILIHKLAPKLTHLGKQTDIFVSVSSAEASFDFVNDISGVYAVQESDGVATVCVRLTGGTLEREVVLMLSSADLSALAGCKPSRQLLF